MTAPEYRGGLCDGLPVDPSLHHHARIIVHCRRAGGLHFYVRRGADYEHVGQFDPAHAA